MTLLNEQQRAAVDHINGPLLILAGAGTGKTRVIVEKVGRLLERVPGLKPENILALTFSNKAAKEMSERAAQQYGDETRKCRFTTFHSFCNRLLSEENQWKAMDEIDHWIFLRRNFDSLELDHFLHVSDPGRFLKDLLEFCSRCHDNLVSAESFSNYVDQLALNPPAPPRTKKKPKFTASEEIARLKEVARVFARSEELQEGAELVSFGAMLSRAAFLLQSSVDLQKKLQNRYRYILVDEFQDTNWAQIRLLQLLAGKSYNIAVVGDPNQAIYHFRGASYTSFELFEKSFPGCKRIELTENYRSTKRILAVAAAAIAANPTSPDRPSIKPLTTPNPDGQRVNVAEFISDDEQAEDVARDILRKMKEGIANRFEDFAVLYRKHGHRNRLVAAFRRHGIPFSIRKLAINSLPAVKDMIASLRAIGDTYDSVSLLRLLLLPRWNIPVSKLAELCHKGRSKRIGLCEILEAEFDARSETDTHQLDRGLVEVVTLLRRYRKIASEVSLHEWIEELRDELGFFARTEDQTAWTAFADFISRWDKQKSATHRLPEFIEYFELFEEAGGSISLEDEEDAIYDETSSEPTSELIVEKQTLKEKTLPQQAMLWNDEKQDDPRGSVQLMTIHAAKGLEFDHVYLLQLTHGQFPTRRQSPLIAFPNELVAGPAPKGDVHKDEERRLFYVALTRARKTLTLCTVSNQKQKPSDFLEQLRNSMCEALEWKPRAPWGVTATDASILPEFMSRPDAPTPPTAEKLVLSDSGIEAYQQCPMKFYFGNIWQVPFTPSPALRFGSIMHNALKKAIEILAHAPDKLDSARIEEILQSQWQENAFVEAAQERKYWRIGLSQLESLRNTSLARLFQLLYQEKSFEFRAGGTKLIGRIDQINRIEGKNVEIVEYKTGRPKTQKDADESLQLTIYARACQEVLDLKPVELVLFNLETGERLSTNRTSDDFRDLDQIVQETSSAVVSGQFQPNPGFHCNFCDFRTICPAKEDLT